MTGAVHHVELWTHDLSEVESGWDWLFDALGWVKADDGWASGRIWTHRDGTYVVLEQSRDVRGDLHERRAPGLNHLALNLDSRDELDQLRAEANSHGWSELFGADYPHAGGPDHTALFLENRQGFEVEIVSSH